MRRRAFLSALLAVLTAGCGESRASHSEAGWTGQIDTLASGRVLVRNEGQGVWPDGAPWQVIEEVRIGALDADGPETFGDIVSFAVDGSGRMWILDRHASELRVFDGRGEYVRTVGRPGSGPGELEQPVRVDVSPDGNIWVMDPGSARLSVFDTTGSYIDGIRVAVGFVMLPWPGGFDSSGFYYAPVARFVPDFRLDLARFDQGYVPLDTLPVPSDPVDRDEFTLTVDGRVVADEPVPFQGTVAWRLASTGTIWGLITDEYRLFEVNGKGDTIRVITKSFEPIAVTSVERAEALDELQSFIEHGGQVDPSRIPDHKPPVRSFFIDAGGHAWVERINPHSAEGSAFDVFDPIGRYLGLVDVPFRLQLYPPPIIRDGLLYGIVRDEMDVEYMVRARIAKPAEKEDALRDG